MSVIGTSASSTSTNDASSYTESTTEYQTPELAQITDTNTVVVSNQDQLETALHNVNVHVISFANNISISRNISFTSTSNRPITIEGNGYLLVSTNNYYIKLSGEGTINLDNLTIYCSVWPLYYVYYMFDATGSDIDFNFSSVSSQSGNTIGLVSTAGTANFQKSTNGDNHFSFFYNSNADTIGYAFVMAHSFLTTDVDITAKVEQGLFFNSVGDNPEFMLDGSTLKLDSNSATSNIYLNGKKGKISFINHSDITINNNNPNAKGIDSSGMFWDAKNSDLDSGTKFVADNSKVNLYSKGMSAIVFRGRGSSFKVNHSIFNIQGDENVDGEYGRYATIRYAWYGDGLFELTNQSKMKIVKTKGQSSGIRMVDPNNKIIVNGGSEFIVDHQDKGNHDYWNYYQAIEFGSGAENSLFEIDGSDSFVSLNADGGPAIESIGSMNITLSNQGSFFATGNSSYGTFSFNGAQIGINLNGGEIFDFKNKKAQGPVVNNISSGSSFKLTQSELSLWRKNQPITGNPTQSFDTFDLSLSGKNFGTFDYSTNPKFESFYQGLSFADFSRISANNSKPVIDKILQPTDADSKIYIHVKVLDSPSIYHDAFAAEVKLEGKVVSADGKTVIPFSGGTGEAMNTYFDQTDKQNGYAAITLPKGTYLNPGDKVVITRAYRGSDEKPIEADPVTLPQAVTAALVPPVPAKLDVDKVSSVDSELSGEGAPKSEVTISLNGKDTGAISQVNDAGKFSIALPKGMKNGDVLQVFLRDHSGLADVPDRPTTNNEVGNINPATELTYHDKVFPAATVVPVKGSLKFESVPDVISFGSHKIVDGTLVMHPSTIAGNLIVQDDRDSEQRTGWRLSLKETKSTMTNGAALSYVNRSGKTLAINDADTVIESNSPSNPVEDNLSDGWKENKQGLKLELAPSAQKIGKYTGTLQWSLMDVPDAK